MLLQQLAQEPGMSTYMVERSLKGIPMDALAAAQQRAIQTAGELTQEGTPIRYIRTAFVPDEGRCMCLFDASSADDVRRLNDRAQIPYDRVVPAMDLSPS
jgi:hypothetical protein